MRAGGRRYRGAAVGRRRGGEERGGKGRLDWNGPSLEGETWNGEAMTSNGGGSRVSRRKEAL